MAGDGAKGLAERLRTARALTFRIRELTCPASSDSTVPEPPPPPGKYPLLPRASGTRPTFASPGGGFLDEPRGANPPFAPVRSGVPPLLHILQGWAPQPGAETPQDPLSNPRLAQRRQTPQAFPRRHECGRWHNSCEGGRALELAAPAFPKVLRGPFHALRSNFQVFKNTGCEPLKTGYESVEVQLGRS